MDFSLNRSRGETKMWCKESSYSINEVTLQTKSPFALIGTHVRIRKALRRFNATFECCAGIIKSELLPFSLIFAIFGQMVGISPKFVSFEPYKSHFGVF